MTALVLKEGKIQVLISYSDEHKKAMGKRREINCRALTEMVRSAIENANGKVTKIRAVTGGLDLLIEGEIHDPTKLLVFKDKVKKINRDAGAEEVFVFGK